MSSLETLSKLIIKEFNTKELQEIPEDLETTTAQEIKISQTGAKNPEISELEQQINFSYSELLQEAVYLLMQIRRNKDKQFKRAEKSEFRKDLKKIRDENPRLMKMFDEAEEQKK